MKMMTKALFKLISANRFTPEDANSSLQGDKMVIPIDMQGFEWLAKTTDNMIMKLLMLNPPLNDLAAQLKTDFFRFSVYRVAGGIDNSKSTDKRPVLGVKTQSFTVEFMKFSAGNMMKEPIEFELGGTTMQQQMQEGGNMVVRVPRDPKIITGQNVLVAVMYSAESGEAYANYMEHPRSSQQLKFLSGIVKVAVASTPQAFGTDKVCAVVDHEVKNLEKPLLIKFPVNHVAMKGLTATEMLD